MASQKYYLKYIFLGAFRIWLKEAKHFFLDCIISKLCEAVVPGFGSCRCNWLISGRVHTSAGDGGGHTLTSGGKPASLRGCHTHTYQLPGLRGCHTHLPAVRLTRLSHTHTLGSCLDYEAVTHTHILSRTRKTVVVQIKNCDIFAVHRVISSDTKLVQNFCVCTWNVLNKGNKFM